MASTVPPCPMCNRNMLRKYESDEVHCRCGFTASGEVLLAARSKAHSVAYRMEPPLVAPDVRPGIRISDSFQELSRCLFWSDPGAPLGNAQKLHDIAVAAGASLGLQLQPEECKGAYLVIDDGQGGQSNLHRSVMYAIAPIDQTERAAELMVGCIAQLRGPGRWWRLKEAVHVIADCGETYYEEVGGQPHVRMRAIYCHAADLDANRPHRRTWVDQLAADGTITPEFATRLRAVDGPDPLDAHVDGISLRQLIEWDEAARRDSPVAMEIRSRYTPAQRDAAAAHWREQIMARRS